MPQDREQEREQLLRVIEASLPETVREALRTSLQSLIEPKVIISKNEVGSEYADQR
jgi:hypothetical protein